jgi:hypothetical protein
LPEDSPTLLKLPGPHPLLRAGSGWRNKMNDDNKEKKRPNANYKMDGDAKEQKRPNANHKMSGDTDDAKEEKERPNANYKLSNQNIEGEEIVHHYNRERRLQNAPQAVRNLYEKQPRRRLGFFYSLVGTKPNAMLFGTIIFLCVMMLMLSFFGFTGDSRELEGNILSVKAKKYEGTVLIDVRKVPRKDKIARNARNIKAYMGPVEIIVFPITEKGKEQNQQPTDVFFHKIFFSNDQEEHYIFTVPFDQNELGFVFQTEKKTLSLTIKAIAPQPSP